MGNPAMSSDLVARSLRTLSDQEQTVGQTLLDDAWAIVTAEVPNASARLNTDPQYSSLVIRVLCAMVLRVLNNPDGKLSEAVDDYQYRLDASVSTGALYLSDDERDLLGLGDGTSDNAFTIRQVAVPYRAMPVQWEFLP